MYLDRCLYVCVCVCVCDMYMHSITFQAFGDDPTTTALEKEMATHSSILAWKISWLEEPNIGYRPWGRKESDTTEQLHFFTFFWFTGMTSRDSWVVKPPVMLCRVPGLVRRPV